MKTKLTRTKRNETKTRWRKENQLEWKISTAIAQLKSKRSVSFTTAASIAVAALGPAVAGDAPRLAAPPLVRPHWPWLPVQLRRLHRRWRRLRPIKNAPYGSQYFSPAFHEDGPISSPVYSPSLFPWFWIFALVWSDGFPFRDLSCYLTCASPAVVRLISWLVVLECGWSGWDTRKLNGILYFVVGFAKWVSVKWLSMHTQILF